MEPGPPRSAGAGGRAVFVGSLFAEGDNAGISFKRIPLAPASFLMPALSCKEVKNPWALFLEGHTEQSGLPAPVQERRDPQTEWVCFI